MSKKNNVSAKFNVQITANYKNLMDEQNEKLRPIRRFFVFKVQFQPFFVYFFF
jgi:hypothetical protein